MTSTMSIAMNRPLPNNARARLVLFATAAVFTLVCTRSSAHADGSAPRAVVQQTGDVVVTILRDKSLDTDQKRQKIEDVAARNFDFQTLSQLVLARNWKKLSPQQQQDFEREFRTHLSVTYGKNIESYNDEKLVITGDREEKRGDWTVTSIIDRKNAEDVKVDYRLRNKDGEWKMIDVIVEGVSLVANFRSQFQDIVSREGPERLIQMLRDKNAKGEAFKTEPQRKPS